MIRELVQSDIPELTKLYNHYIISGVETFETEVLTEEQMLSRSMWIALDNPYFVFPKDNTIAGFCYAIPWKERPAYANTYETLVYVSPEFVRQGIGYSLMQNLISECRNRGCRVLIASIAASNLSALSLFEKLGFQKVSHFHEVANKFGQWHDVVEYELLL